MPHKKFLCKIQNSTFALLIGKKVSVLSELKDNPNSFPVLKGAFQRGRIQSGIDVWNNQIDQKLQQNGPGKIQMPIAYPFQV